MPGKWTHLDILKWMNSRTLLQRQHVPLFKVPVGVLSELLLTKGFVFLKVSLQSFKDSCGERTGVSGRNPACTRTLFFGLSEFSVYLWSPEERLLTFLELWSQCDQNTSYRLSWSTLSPCLCCFIWGFCMNRQWHKRVRKALHFSFRRSWITRGLSEQTWWHLGDMLTVSVAARWMVDLDWIGPSNSNTLSLMQRLSKARLENSVACCYFRHCSILW